jgi:hypothetical protein
MEEIWALRIAVDAALFAVGAAQKPDLQSSPPSRSSVHRDNVRVLHPNRRPRRAAEDRSF